jgi:hypothetical protein
MTDTTRDVPPSAAETVAALEQAWGIDLPLAAGVVEVLFDGRLHRLADLVARAGVSREGVKQILNALGADVESSGREVQLRADRIDDLRAVLPQPPPPELDARLDDVIAAARADLPPPRRDLDHVPATPETVRRRARWLVERFHLRGRRLVVLGDRDLTGLAVAVLEPSASVTVVDVDDAILAVIARHAERVGLDVRTWFADLRVGLPEGLQASADLAFSDPPYTPEGIALFAQRGLDGLARTGWARIGLCHGTGERQVELSFQVQRALARLGLVFETMLPGFNAYEGAEALGSRSALYLCRPTKRAWKRSETHDGRARIYSHGATALEARSRLPADLAAQADAGRDELLVGDGWGDERAIPIPEYVATLSGAAVGIRKLAAAADGVCIDLTAGFAAHLPRVLLLGLGQALTAVVAADEGLALLEAHEDLYRLIRSGYTLTVRRHNSGIAVVERRAAERHSPLAAAAAELAHRTGAVAVNALREALVASSRGSAERLVKNAARAIITEAELPAVAGEARLAELSLTDLDAAARVLTRTLESAS